MEVSEDDSAEKWRIRIWAWAMEMLYLECDSPHPFPAAEPERRGSVRALLLRGHAVRQGVDLEEEREVGEGG